MKFAYAVTTAAMLALAACSNLAGPRPPVSEQLITATATIDSVNKADRIVQLHDDQTGQAYTVYANDGIKNLDQLTAGDVVVVEYYDATAVSMATADSPEASAAMVAGEAPKGALPGGIAVQTETIVVEFLSYSDGIATFRTPDGLTRRTAVKPELQDFASKAHRGDMIQVTMTEAVAISIAKAPTT